MASSSQINVEVRHTDASKGKGLFAKTDIKEGAIIFEEKPLVSCQFSWNAEYKYKACDHCLKPLETAQENARRLTGQPNLELPFPDCCPTIKSKFTVCSACGTEYCSSECKIEAFNQYHKTICIQTTARDIVHPLEHLNDVWKHIHYPPETNTVMLIVRLLARIIQAPDAEEAINETLQFCHRTVNENADLAHKLLGPKFADQISLLRNLLIKAIPNKGIEQFLSPSGFESLLALIGTNGQGVGTSSLSQWVKRTANSPLSDMEQDSLDKFIDKLYDDMDLKSGHFLDNEGVALYSLQSACNHSCAPNAEPSFPYNNNTLALVATEDIKEGDEVFISYLDECDLHRSRHSRQKELRENYLFNCNCPKCQDQASDPDETSEEEMSE